MVLVAIEYLQRPQLIAVIRAQEGCRSLARILPVAVDPLEGRRCPPSCSCCEECHILAKWRRKEGEHLHRLRRQQAMVNPFPHSHRRWSPAVLRFR